jgi:uncharacterized membrane protein YidH (DUF202 family)
MNFVQKAGRVLLLSSTLVVASILAAMLGALGLFLVERGRELGERPHFLSGLGIVLIGLAVNFACVFALLQIKKADLHLVPPEKK